MRARINEQHLRADQDYTLPGIAGRIGRSYLRKGDGVQWRSGSGIATGTFLGVVAQDAVNPFAEVVLVEDALGEQHWLWASRTHHGAHILADHEL